jgi:universal stress protein A
MRILLAVDGSEPSEAAARLLAARPWPEDAIVRVLSVVHMAYLPATPFLVDAGVNYQELQKPLLDLAEQVTDSTVAMLAARGLDAEKAVRRGDPRTQIIEEATTWRADLIVIGSHGRTGLERILMGSVAEYVVRHAGCSVEVAREPLWQPAEPAGEPS